jgi:LPS-assembly lipoprotein
MTLCPRQAFVGRIKISMKILQIAIISLLLAALTGCGFHLRGDVSLPSNMQVLYIDGVNRDSNFAVELRRSLRGNGVNVVEDVNTAQAVVKLSNVRFDRRVLSVSGNTGKVREYQLLYGAEVIVLDRAGEVILPAQRLRLVRDYVFDENDVLGKSSEEAQLRKEMQTDLISKILRRLQAEQPAKTQG